MLYDNDDLKSFKRGVTMKMIRRSQTQNLRARLAKQRRLGEAFGDASKLDPRLRVMAAASRLLKTRQSQRTLSKTIRKV
jgi:hypothetical protein